MKTILKGKVSEQAADGKACGLFNSYTNSNQDLTCHLNVDDGR